MTPTQMAMHAEAVAVGLSDNDEAETCICCEGTGRCYECEGEGRVEYQLAARSPRQISPEYREDDCEDCGGTGECSRCEGSGKEVL